MEEKNDNDRFIKTVFGWRAAALNEDMEPHFHMNKAQVETHTYVRLTVYAKHAQSTNTLRNTHPPHIQLTLIHSTLCTHSVTHLPTHSLHLANTLAHTPSTLGTHLPLHPLINTFLSKPKEKVLQL